MARRTELAAAWLVAALLAAAAACQKHRDPPAGAAPLVARPGVPLAVPAAPVPVPIDGEWEPVWNDVASRVVFVDATGRAEARPYSELRFLEAGDALLVGLYAADEDIRSGERFELAIGSRSMTLDPRGAITPAVPGARAAVDLDGTIDQPGDYDEEWKIELSIPIAALGAQAGAPVPVHARRCDTPKDGVVRCGGWDGALAPLVAR